MELQGVKTLVTGTALEGKDKKMAEESIPGMRLGPNPVTKAADRASGGHEASEFFQHGSFLAREYVLPGNMYR
jgi:hypothetical protein